MCIETGQVQYKPVRCAKQLCTSTTSTYLCKYKPLCGLSLCTAEGVVSPPRWAGGGPASLYGTNLYRSMVLSYDLQIHFFLCGDVIFVTTVMFRFIQVI